MYFIWPFTSNCLPSFMHSTECRHRIECWLLLRQTYTRSHVYIYIYIWCSRRMLHKRQFQEAKARWRKETNMINAMPCNIIYAYRVDLVLIVDRASAVLKFFTQALATVSDWQTQNPSYRLQSCSPDVWYCRAYCLSTAPLLIAYVCCNLCLHLMLFTDTGNQFSCLSLYVWCVRMWLRAI